jgi:hypothetical protein
MIVRPSYNIDLNKIKIIHVPGLGKRNPNNERRIMRSWTIWGVEAEPFKIGWYDNEPWIKKFKRLTDRIDALSKQGYKVALVGDSAGASVIINAYAARPEDVIAVVALCGKINRSGKIGQKYRSNNPAFVPSVSSTVSAIENLNDEQRSHILSRYAIFDELVKPADSIIPGAKNRRILSAGHFLTIATQLVFGAPSFIKFIKKQAH